jgi:serine protease
MLGVAAKIWSNHPTATNAQVRAALQQGASIPGKAPGSRDDSYGYGIIDAKKSLDILAKAV